MTSSELIRAAGDDPDAFGELFDRHALVLRQWLLANTRDVATANDLLSETFLVAWRNRRRLRGEGEDSGVAWLFAIARNLQLRHHRRARVEARWRRKTAASLDRVEPDHTSATDARLDAEALSPSVQAAFTTLSAEQRQAVGYRVLGELGYAEVADRMQSSTVTARTRVHRGLHALREALDKGTGT